MGATRLAAGDEAELLRQYVVARHAEVVVRHTAQAARVHDLENLLGSALGRLDRFDLTALRKVHEPHEIACGASVAPLAPPVWADFAPDAMRGWRALLSDPRRQHLRLNEAQVRYQRARRDNDEAEAARRGAILRAGRRHREECAARDAEARTHNEALDQFAGDLGSGDRLGVARYFGLVLSGSVYPIDFPQHFRIMYLPQLKELVLEVTLPGIEVIPTVSELQHVSESDEVAVRPRGSAQIESLYGSVVAQVILRTLHELFDSDQHDWLDTVTVNGMTTQGAAGRASRRGCLVSVSTSRARFAGLNLRLDDPRSNLAELGGVVLYSCQRQQPICDLRLVDHRYIVETDVLTDVDQRLALEDLTPGQFEHLVHGLLARMGMHIKHTRSSPDGVVDCLIFDDRPVLGGGVVVHAARRDQSLDVWTVQKLQRAVTDAGASRGILLTTAGIDPRSHAYASGKPLELVDGAGILELIARHTGIRARVSRQDRS